MDESSSLCARHERTRPVSMGRQKDNITAGYVFRRLQARSGPARRGAGFARVIFTVSYPELEPWAVRR